MVLNISARVKTFICVFIYLYVHLTALYILINTMRNKIKSVLSIGDGWTRMS